MIAEDDAIRILEGGQRIVPGRVSRRPWVTSTKPPGREAEALDAYRMAQSKAMDMGRPGLLELKVTALELRLGQADVADGALQ